MKQVDTIKWITEDKKVITFYILEEDKCVITLRKQNNTEPLTEDQFKTLISDLKNLDVLRQFKNLKSMVESLK